MSLPLYEPLTDPSKNRLTVFPIEYFDIWDAYKKQLASFWTAEEIDFSKDYDDFQKLNKDEQHFIKMVLAFFAASDTIVNINIGERFIKDVQIREAIICYNYQMMMENIHSEVYSLQIDNIIHDTEEKDKLFRALEFFPCVQKKADWAKKWTESDAPFAQRLIAFAIVEGILFSGSFAAIFWLKKRNLLPGLANSNIAISADENSHCAFAVLLYSKVLNRLDEVAIHDMIKEAVDIEIEFICDSLKCAVLGINPESMCEYIKYVADRLLVSLGYNKYYNATNPLSHLMESIGSETKVNFFEQRSTQYQRASVFNKTKESTFELTEDF